MLARTRSRCSLPPCGYRDAVSGLDSRLQRALRNAVDRVPVLRRVVKSAPVQHAVQTVRGARVVSEPLRFAVSELAASRTASYRLRNSDLRLLVRHGTRDVNILNEIFGGTSAHLSYEPPAELAVALDADPAPKMLDLGANIGLFGLYALGRWPSAGVHSFEPDPANLKLLRRVIAINDLAERWSVTEAAVGSERSTMSFEAGLYSESRLLIAGAPASGHRTIDVQSVDIFAEDHDASLLKMDIEGGEWAILTDPRLTELRAKAVVLEWHERGCPEADAHAAAQHLLRAAGYGRIEDVEVGNGSGVLWAWRDVGQA